MSLAQVLISDLPLTLKVRFISTDDVPIISGIGVVEEAIFHGSFDQSVSYVDDFGSLNAHDLHGPDPTTYLIHDACWLLLLSRLGVDPGDDPRRIVKLLFNTCAAPRRTVMARY